MLWTGTKNKQMSPKGKKVGFIYTFGLLVFPFVYQFNSRIDVLVQSSFGNDYFTRISASFHFFVVYTWKRMYLLHSSLLLYWNEIIVYRLNCHLSNTGSDTGSVAFRARSELTSSKFWLNWNLSYLECRWNKPKLQ